MKKLLSIFLALVLVLSLASLVACKTDDANPTDAGGTPTDAGGTPTDAGGDDTDIDLSKTKPNEHVQEKLDAGMEVLIAFVPPTLEDEFMVLISEGLKEEMGQKGFTVVYSSPEYDGAKQFEIVENYVTMGCAAVGTIPMDADAFVDLMLTARDAGTYLCFLGRIPDFEVMGACNVDVIESSNACYDMACAWMETVYPDAADGSVHVAVLGQTNNIENKRRSEQLKTNVEGDSRMTLGYYVDKCNSIDAGFTDSEAALLSDPEIRLFLNFSTSASIGVNNYIVANFAGQLDEFGVFTMGNNNSLFELIDMAGQGDESICRGTIKQGGNAPWGGLRDVMYGLLLEGKEPPYVFYEHMWSYTSGEFEFDYDNGVIQE